MTQQLPALPFAALSLRLLILTLRPSSAARYTTVRGRNRRLSAGRKALEK
jgi:hypothetical protein